jgi:peptidoglycan L-alanyl-D-glutamate endopeptidase CwlK
MTQWDARSLRNLNGIHPDLRRVMDAARMASPVVFRVIEGLRTKERQAELVAQGFSKTMNSRHLTGHAVDIWPIDPATGEAVSGLNDKRLWELYRLIAPIIKDVAQAEGVKITWGGDWKSFRDGPHFELDRNAYPVGARMNAANLFADDFDPQPVAKPAASVPVLMIGSKGEAVRALQARLADLRYFSGRQDGVFGPRTKGAVMEFQTDNDLVADGKVGPQTRAVLATAVPRALREVTREDLADSRTIKAAGEGKTITAATVTVAGAGAAVGAMEQAVEVAQRAGSLVAVAASAGPWVIALIAVSIGGFLLWRRFQRIEELRIEDARTGANDSR